MKKIALFVIILSLATFLYGYTHFKAPAAWEDLRFPANAIDPVGVTGAASRDSNDGLLSFAGNADNIIAVQAQMPHGWKNGSEIEPHLHLLNTADATGTTRWRLEWKIADPGDEFPTVYASETITVVVTDSDTKHQMFGFSKIDMTGYQASCMMIMRLTRLASSDGADTYNTPVKLLEFDIHYQQEAFGSINEHGEQY